MLQLDYYYGIEAEQFSFYRVPRLLIKDELYTGPTGSKQLPLGTITIKETQAPEGYLINPTVYTVKITTKKCTEAGSSRGRKRKCTESRYK